MATPLPSSAAAIRCNAAPQGALAAVIRRGASLASTARPRASGKLRACDPRRWQVAPACRDHTLADGKQMSACPVKEEPSLLRPSNRPRSPRSTQAPGAIAEAVRPPEMAPAWCRAAARDGTVPHIEAVIQHRSGGTMNGTLQCSSAQYRPVVGCALPSKPTIVWGDRDTRPRGELDSGEARAPHGAVLPDRAGITSNVGDWLRRQWEGKAPREPSTGSRIEPNREE